MKYYIKQSVFTLAESFTVKNEYAEDVYRVEGSFFRYPKEFNIYDMNGRLVSHIEKQMMKMFSHFDIKTQNVSLTVRNNFSFFRQSISIVGSDWNLVGDFWSHNYQVIQGNHPIMTIQKHWFTWGDSYELNIANPDDVALCLSIVIVVDKLIAEATNNS